MNPQVKDLISRMLAKDPKERITVLEMKVLMFICVFYSFHRDMNESSDKN